MGSESLNALVADTSLKRAIGLMHRKSLKSNECMLFIFERSSRYGIWMLNMQFPIDIIWLDERKRIVSFVKNAKPCKSIFNCKAYYPEKRSKYIIETNAGFMKAKSDASNKTVRFRA